MQAKQVLLVRTDIKMSVGKIVSQAAHASVAVILDIFKDVDGYNSDTTEAIFEWLNGPFTKIALRIDSEEQLVDIYNKANYLRIPCSLITDNGKTEFNGVPTITCAAIGPDVGSKIDKLTGQLKLL